jgi:hypothetical protein
MPIMKAIMKQEIEKSISQLLKTTQILSIDNNDESVCCNPMPVTV